MYIIVINIYNVKLLRGSKDINLQKTGSNLFNYITYEAELFIYFIIIVYN